MNHYLVEHYWPGVTRERLHAAAGRLYSAAEEMARAGRAVRCLRSTMVPGDEVAFVVFEADSRALVEEAYARAAIRFDRILDVFEVAATPELSPGATSNFTFPRAEEAT